MVLNDIIEQAAGRHSRASDHGGKNFDENFQVISIFCFPYFNIRSLRVKVKKKRMKKKKVSFFNLKTIFQYLLSPFFAMRSSWKNNFHAEIAKSFFEN